MENSIENVLKQNIKALENVNIEDAKIKAQILLSFVLNKQKQYLTINKNEIIDEEILNKYQQGIEKLRQNIPLQYITNVQEFMGLNFYVDENVLIPRYDTEVLVNEVVKRKQNNQILKILDMCTGSGAIAISLQKLLNNSTVYAVDISSRALEIARKNSETNKTKVNFIQSNMFENIQDKDFDIIVSNPPYIATNAIQGLNEDVKKEPIIALNGGADGLEFYRILANESHKYLKNNGMLIMEIGFNQKESVEKILFDVGKYEEIHCIKDFNQNDRVILCKKK